MSFSSVLRVVGTISRRGRRHAVACLSGILAAVGVVAPASAQVVAFGTCLQGACELPADVDFTWATAVSASGTEDTGPPAYWAGTWALRSHVVLADGRVIGVGGGESIESACWTDDAVNLIGHEVPTISAESGIVGIASTAIATLLLDREGRITGVDGGPLLTATDVICNEYGPFGCLEWCEWGLGTDFEPGTPPAELGAMRAVFAGRQQGAGAVDALGRARVWGFMPDLPEDLPPVRQIASGAGIWSTPNCVLLFENGTVESVGLHGYPPPPDLEGVVQIAASPIATMAVLEDGTLRAWGTPLQENRWRPPEDLGPVDSVQACNERFAALLRDGTVRVWGEPFVSVPADLPPLRAISISPHHVLGIMDGDCNGNGVPDLADIHAGIEADCNGNRIPDACEIAEGFEADADGDGVPDACLRRVLDVPGNVATLAEAMAAIAARPAVAGETWEIRLAPGVHVGPFEIADRSISIRGIDAGSPSVLVSADPDRSVVAAWSNANGDTPPTLHLENLLIRGSGGVATRGGGVRADGVRLHMVECSIEGHAAEVGGGIAASGLAPGSRLEQVRIGCNEAQLGGGLAIEKGGEPLELVDCVVCGNRPEAIRGAWIDGGGNLVCMVPEDLDGDGVVGPRDLSRLLGRWGSAPKGTCLESDLDGDGRVDGRDLALLLESWGSRVAAAPGRSGP